jgi:hypothetical protein
VLAICCFVSCEVLTVGMRRADLGPYDKRKSRRIEITESAPDTASSSSRPNARPFPTVLGEVFLSNKLSAKDSQALSYAAQAGGNADVGIERLAKAGNWGQAPKNLARDLTKALMAGVDMPVVFTWPIPIWDTVNLVQTMCDYPFLLPHELIEHIVRKGGLAQLLVAQEEFPELFRNLGAACRSHALPPGATIAVGIHGDGVPFTKKDSIEIISFNFLAMPTADRIPFTGISKKHLCHCGCKGKHTWHAILEVLKWSLLMCFVGRVSAYLPDGSAWQVARDGIGTLRQGTQLSYHALLLQFRGDWPFLRTLFDFPAWNQPRICFLCRCGPRGSDMPFTDPSSSSKWRRFRYAANEFIQELRLLGVSICALLSLPAFTIACVLLDWLHVVDLGVGADVLGCFFYDLISTDGIIEGSNQEERLSTLWKILKEWYALHKPPCVLDNLTDTMIRKSGTSKPKLRAKGAECRYLIPFAVYLSDKLRHNGPHWSTIAAMFFHLHMIQLAISADVYDADYAKEHCRLFCVLYISLAEEALARGRDLMWQPKPKMHLLQEMVEYLAPEHGSPKHFWCYRDESWCGFWARASKRRGGANTASVTAMRFLNRYRALMAKQF